MWSHQVVFFQPLFCNLSNLGQRVEEIQVQHVFTIGAIEPLVVPVNGTDNAALLLPGYLCGNSGN